MICDIARGDIKNSDSRARLNQRARELPPQLPAPAGDDYYFTFDAKIILRHNFGPKVLLRSTCRLRLRLNSAASLPDGSVFRLRRSRCEAGLCPAVDSVRALPLILQG